MNGQTSESQMFEIILREGAYASGVVLFAKTPTLDKALEFVRRFTIDGFIITSFWRKQGNDHVLDVHDWYDGFCTNPPPPLARIIAPCDFDPFAQNN